MVKILAAWLMFFLVGLFFLNEGARHRRRVRWLRCLRSLHNAKANAIVVEINDLMLADLHDRAGSRNG